jgi:hypothetical protein
MAATYLWGRIRLRFELLDGLESPVGCSERLSGIGAIAQVHLVFADYDLVKPV